MDMNEKDKEGIFEFLDEHQFIPITTVELLISKRFKLTPDESRKIFHEWVRTYFDRHPDQLKMLTQKVNER
jgi:hypothetical protein